MGNEAPLNRDLTADSKVDLSGATEQAFKSGIHTVSDAKIREILPHGEGLISIQTIEYYDVSSLTALVWPRLLRSSFWSSESRCYISPFIAIEYFAQCAAVGQCLGPKTSETGQERRGAVIRTRNLKSLVSELDPEKLIRVSVNWTEISGGAFSVEGRAESIASGELLVSGLLTIVEYATRD